MMQKLTYQPRDGSFRRSKNTNSLPMNSKLSDYGKEFSTQGPNYHTIVCHRQRNNYYDSSVLWLVAGKRTFPKLVHKFTE